MIKMSTANSKFMFSYLLSNLILCSSSVMDFKQTEVQGEAAKMFGSSSRRAVVIKTIQHVVFDPSTSALPTTTVSNPVTAPTPTTVNPPPDTSSSPAIVTVPSATPATPIPTTNTPTGAQSGSNPVTTYPTPVGGVPVTNPVVAPPATATNAPGKSWCVAKSGVPEAALQAALDYACANGVDCSGIQPGASCYSPITLQGHASYAFNGYYQKNPVQTSCDFGGCAMITTTNPSSGSCILTTYSPSPTTSSPTPNTTSTSGATPTGSGAPPTVLNASNPDSGGTTNPAAGGGTINPAFGGGTTGFADSPQSVSTSMSRRLRPFVSCIILVTPIITGWIVLET